jgi:mannose-6-phosphate isomerase-like protein (cupin superfamily)
MRIQKNCVLVPEVPDLLLKILPDQGCIELQRDRPDKLHDWHSHHVDEILIVLKGGLDFEWDHGRELCRPGDVIELPAGCRHKSVAAETGAIYLIAFRRKNV